MKFYLTSLAGILVLALTFLSLFNCGYSLRGVGTSLPPDIKSLSVPLFKNMTTRYELEVKLTRAVVDEFVRRGKLKLESNPDAADAILEGECTSFTVIPVALTSQGRADKYKLTLTCKVVFKTRTTGQILFSQEALSFVEEYQVPEGQSFEAVQSEAIDRVTPLFARSLVAAILEGF